uniref:Voltage-dependent anion-selective channel n=1 Tax=Strongyloides papillosus TaxID=174720 RepID=A0A0N5BGJ7_STREA
MAPPSYADLGKAARDLFNKGHHVGNVKLDITNKTGYNKEYEIKTSATHDLSKEVLGANFDFKYKVPEYGVTFTESISSNNTLKSVLDISDQFSKGLKVTLEGLYSFKDESRKANLKTEYVKPNLKVNSNLSLLGAPILDTSAVTEYKDLLIGVQAIADVSKSEIKSTNVTISRVTPQFITTVFLNNGNMMGASFFHKPSSAVDLGVQVNYKVGDENATYGLAAKYDVSRDLYVKGKINNSSDVVVSATHKLNNELSLTGSSQFSLLSASNGKNKIGFGIEYSV